MKNSDFILESKIAELNKNENSKQPDQPNAAWNFSSKTLEAWNLGSKWIVQLKKLFKV